MNRSKMIRYQICKSNNSEELQFQVEQMMKNGWILYGTLVVENSVYYQTMVKVKHEQDSKVPSTS